MRSLFAQLFALAFPRFRRDMSDPVARLLADTGLTHGEREALLALRHD